MVSRWGCVPSSFMTQISGFPSTRASNAIRLPSGDQTGDPTVYPNSWVICLGLLPSAFDDRSATVRSGRS